MKTLIPVKITIRQYYGTRFNVACQAIVRVGNTSMTSTIHFYKSRTSEIDYTIHDSLLKFAKRLHIAELLHETCCNACKETTREFGINLYRKFSLAKVGGAYKVVSND